MAQLLLIKNANTVHKTIGDGVGVFDDEHIFFPREIEAFTILQIKGSRDEVWARIVQTFPERRDVYRVVGRWTFIRPKDKKIIEADRLTWKDKNGDWCFVNVDPKYKWSLKNLTVNEKTTLKNVDIGSGEKDQILKRLSIDFGEHDDRNNQKVPDING